MMRIDALLREIGAAESRNKARQMIERGLVLIDGKPVTKPSVKTTAEHVTVTGDLGFVGRGRLKIQKAMDDFDIDVKDKVCFDIGASTGGFTEELLARGARKVYAVDVGHDQLHESLRKDPRTVSMEGVDARDLSKREDLEPADFATMDVSFISIRAVLPTLIPLFRAFEMLVLLKPQFEGGGKPVRLESDHREILIDVRKYLEKEGFTVENAAVSPVRGSDGNIEYLLHLTRRKGKSFPIENLASEAFHRP